MTLVLPKRPDGQPVMDVADLAGRLFRFAVQVVDFMRNMPTIEVRTMRTDGTLPITVLTDTRKPIGVVRLRSYLADDPSSAIVESGISWNPSEDTNEPGVVVTELEGVAAGPGDEVECVLLVLGERD